MNPEPIVELHAIVRGRVQGVSFRASTAARARALNLSGWVRNQPDGTVELLAQGPKRDLSMFLEQLRALTPPVCVETIEESWSTPANTLADFHIRL